jgi:glycosyltransferase involved in cell wall biosynthesis
VTASFTHAATRQSKRSDAAALCRSFADSARFGGLIVTSSRRGEAGLLLGAGPYCRRRSTQPDTARVAARHIDMECSNSKSERYMKLIYDVIGAPRGLGGTELHAREFLHAWMQQYPDDEVLVVGRRWAELEKEFARVRWITWPTSSPVLRIVGQLVLIPILMRAHKAHVLLVSLPVLSPLSPKRRSFVFSHDWRHLARPEEFSIMRRAYRMIWRSSVNRAAITFCISRKTLRETANIAPDSRRVLAESGHDHALRWTAESPDSPTLRALAGEGDVVVTFGHWNNKRPELVIAALATLEPAVSPLLVVLGARGEYQERLHRLALAHGVSEKVRFPGFVPEDEYQAIMRRADCVVLASTDEGFGLPVAEALSLGHPVVVTSDSGLGETFGGSVRAVPPEVDAMGRAISDALAQGHTTSHPSARPSWRDTAKIVREAILSATT